MAFVSLHTPEPVPSGGDEPPAEDRKPRAPPIEEERGPQVPVELPGRGGAPERAAKEPCATVGPG